MYPLEDNLDVCRLCFSGLQRPLEIAVDCAEIPYRLRQQSAAKNDERVHLEEGNGMRLVQETDGDEDGTRRAK